MSKVKKDKVNLIGSPSESFSKLPDAASQSALDDAIENQPDNLKIQLKKNKAIADCYATIAESLEDDRESRKKYGKWIFIVVSAFALIVISIITFDSKLSDSVKIALLGSTSFNVIGLLAAVVRYLFSNNYHKFFIEPK